MLLCAWLLIRTSYMSTQYQLYVHTRVHSQSKHGHACQLLNDKSSGLVPHKTKPHPQWKHTHARTLCTCIHTQPYSITECL